MKRKSKACNCIYFASRGNVMGGCKHPKAVSACLYRYLDECDKSQSRYRKNKNIPIIGKEPA